MALIRGIGSNFPCPVCVVPSKYLSQVHTFYPRRTAATAQNIVWDKHSNLGEKDQELQKESLRNVEVY